MLGVKFFQIVTGNFNMTTDEIVKLCEKYDIEHYTINDDMSIDVDGDIEFYALNSTTLPLSFSKVYGSFHCLHNHFTTLKGCPNYVCGTFICSFNELTSLEYCPTYIGINFGCLGNQINCRHLIPDVAGNLYSNCLWKF